MFLKHQLLIPPEKGAWTTLSCCLGDGVQDGGYYHSRLGIVPSSPLSYDHQKACALWDSSEALVDA